MCNKTSKTIEYCKIFLRWIIKRAHGMLFVSVVLGVVLKMFTTRGSDFVATVMTTTEWEQVAAARVYADSMDVRPFVEYPYFATADTLLASFIDNLVVVCKHEGFMSGVLNSFVLMNVITTVSNVVFFVGAGLLVQPLLLISATGDVEPNTTAIFLQTNDLSTLAFAQSSILAACDWTPIPRASHLRACNATVPRYRPFTALLTEVATTSGSELSVTSIGTNSDLVAVLASWPCSAMLNPPAFFTTQDATNTLEIRHLKYFTLAPAPVDPSCRAKFILPVRHILRLLRMATNTAVSLHVLDTV
jgi:hypothetical protein